MRITEEMLEIKVELLNIMTGHGDSKYGEVGRYTLDYANGGVALHQHLRTGGEKDILGGHETGRILFYRMIAYMDGMKDSEPMVKVWTHYHERTDQFIIFIGGYALGKSSCCGSIANKIAKGIGQKTITHTTYLKTTGKAIHKEEEVY